MSHGPWVRGVRSGSPSGEARLQTPVGSVMKACVVLFIYR